MIKIRNLNSYSSFILIYFALMMVYWVGLQLFGPKDQTINLLYSFGLNTLALIGGILGVLVARKWGGMRSALGKGIMLMSLGLISWGGIGGYIWSYYNFVLQQEIPYPSFSDVGFIGAVPLWVLGMYFLAKATGVKYGLRNVMGKMYLLLFPLAMFGASYYLLVTIARGGSVTDGVGAVKTFFDFAYPIGDVVIITIALLIYGLTLKLLGGLYKWPARTVLAGFVVMFFADMAFSYSTTVETYYNGNYADLLFTIALFLMSFGITSFDTAILRRGTKEELVNG